MADHHEEDDEEEPFVYTGDRPPQHVTHVVIDKSLSDIPAEAFIDHTSLLSVTFHDGMRKIGMGAFRRCRRLKHLKNFKYVQHIDDEAFMSCSALEDFECDALEIIGIFAFGFCHSLNSFVLPSIRRICRDAFADCHSLINMKLSEELEQSIEPNAFEGCINLLSITMPLRRGILDASTLDDCESLIGVDLIGIHEFISELSLERWREDMEEQISRITAVLLWGWDGSTFSSGIFTSRTTAVVDWIDTIIQRVEFYRDIHQMLIKEALVILELALWKKSLNEVNKKDFSSTEPETKKLKVDVDSVRKEHRVKCGADIIIKNVLPFLKLTELQL